MSASFFLSCTEIRMLAIIHFDSLIANFKCIITSLSNMMPIISKSQHVHIHVHLPLTFHSDEKAMKFIQLERLYHEQLLANLSSIQEQWGEYQLN